MRDVTDLVARLEAIAEELSDRALDALREAVDSGVSERPPEERQLTRARKAVEKAVGLLSAAPDDGSVDGSRR